jgi:hypothetical protein
MSVDGGIRATTTTLTSQMYCKELFTAVQNKTCGMLTSSEVHIGIQLLTLKQEQFEWKL